MTQLLEHDWETAGQLYQQAMVPRENANAVIAYAMFYLAAIDRIPQAIRLYTEAEKRDPLHAGYKANLAGLLLFTGDAEAAARKARETLQLNPRNVLAITYLIWAYTETGNSAAAQRQLDSIPPALQEQPRIKAVAGLYYAAQGDQGKARQIYQELLDNLPPFGLISVARLAMRLGEVEECIDLMERAVEERSWSQFFSTRPEFKHNEALRDHPRYQAYLKRIGLDDESVAALHQKLSFD